MVNHAQRGPDSARRVEAFRLESLGALLPLFAASLDAADEAARRDLAAGKPSRFQADLAAVRANLVSYEQRWQAELGAGFRQWPKSAAVEQPSGLTLVSDEELAAQLIGERTIEALEQRFNDALDPIANRLSALSAELGDNEPGESGLGEKRRPTINPIAPRQLVDALLRTLPSPECSEPLRLAVLTGFERVCTDRLAGFYSRINMQLAGSGHAPDRGGSPGVGTAAAGDTFAIEPVQHRAHERASIAESARIHGLRRWAYRRTGSQAATAQGRVLLDGEFLMILSLLQADARANPDPSAGDLPAQLRGHILRGASGLGIDPGTASLADEQSAAIVLAGSLVEAALADHALDPPAAALLARLCYPLCNRIVSDPGLFDVPAHPVRQLLDEVLGALDANPEASPEDPAMRGAAIEAASGVLFDLHEPDRAFEQSLQSLTQRLQAGRTRAALARRRQVQSVEGQQRREQAQLVAHRALRDVMAGHSLLVPMAAFLEREWSRALMQAWLRSGDESDAVLRLIDTGMRLVELDAFAAQCNGSAVADGLLSIEGALRSVLLANGITEGQADEEIAVIVKSLADPDQGRKLPYLAPDPLKVTAHGETLGYEVGEWFTVDSGTAARRLQLAWRQPDTDRALLLDRSGRPATGLGLEELAALHAAGRLRRHRVHGPIEDLLSRWENELAAG